VIADDSAQITDLAADDHACLTFGEPAELFDLTAAFVRDGLSSGLKVVWVSDSGPARALAELEQRGIATGPAVAAGQLAAAPSEGQILTGHGFAAEHALNWLTEQMAACREGEFPGLRVAVDMSWALRPVNGIEQLPEFERSVADAVAGTTVAMLCQYDRERFDPVTLASVTPFHTRSVAAATYYQDAVLRICRQYAPPGIRLAGEIDYKAEEPLRLALAEAIRFDGDITVNLSDLSFIDASSTRMIMEVARTLARPRRMIIWCSPAVAARFVLFGGGDAETVSLVTLRDC
jgi:anti-anti-sigma regulatory factor